MSTLAKPATAAFEDTNGDGAITLDDAGDWLAEFFFLPGDWAIWAAAEYAPPVARFLELDASAYGGVLSGFLSALGWIALAIGGSIGYRAVRDADEALTAAIVRGWQEACRLYRVAMRRLKLRHHGKAPRRKVEPVLIDEELELDADEIRTLKLHAALEPGYALATSELAAELEVRRDQVAERCKRLVRLKLLATTLGAGNGETAYTLTPAGRALLVFRRL